MSATRHNPDGPGPDRDGTGYAPLGGPPAAEAGTAGRPPATPAVPVRPAGTDPAGLPGAPARPASPEEPADGAAGWFRLRDRSGGSGTRTDLPAPRSPQHPAGEAHPPADAPRDAPETGNAPDDGSEPGGAARPAEPTPVSAAPADPRPAAHPTTTETPTTEPAHPEPVDTEQAAGEPLDAEPPHAHPADAQQIDAEQLGAQPAAAQPAAAQPAGAQPTDAQRTEAEPTNAEPTNAERTNAERTNAEPIGAPSPDTVLPVPDGAAAGTASALRARTMLTPIVTAPRRDGRAPSDGERTQRSATGDPELALGAYRWRFHHETLRELVDEPDQLRDIRDRLTEKLDRAADNAARARLLSLRAVASRILGELGRALTDARLALGFAEATGELRRIAIAQARLAHVLQWRGDFAEADQLFAEANSPELPDRLRATMHEHAGRSCYDQGRYIEACNHFERALELRKTQDPDLIARTELALDAVLARVSRDGWGPYPRSHDEVLRIRRAPTPMFDDRAHRWGYAGPDGRPVLDAAYADAQPFREGVAWVRRPEVAAWELITETAQRLITPSAGYLAVRAFSDGLAWVSRDGAGSWFAIDTANRVQVPGRFDDVRPFRRGVAAVRRGGWGAVDTVGRMVLPMRYAAFVTALTDGRYLDGFTDEGLAIVQGAGGKGVVDRVGRLIVPTVHPDLVIHPVAFLVGTATGRWGALDRRGKPLIEAVHRSRTEVIDQIDRLLADTKPVL